LILAQKYDRHLELGSQYS